MPTIKYDWQASNPPAPDVYMTRNGDTKHQIARYWDGKHWYGLIIVSPKEFPDRPRIYWGRNSYEPRPISPSWQTKTEYIGRKLPEPKFPKVAKQMFWGRRYNEYTDTELLNKAIELKVIGPIFRQHMQAILNGQETEIPKTKATSVTDDMVNLVNRLSTSPTVNFEVWERLLSYAPDSLRVRHSVHRGDRRLVNGIWVECVNPITNEWGPVKSDPIPTHEITAGYYPGTGEIELSWAPVGKRPIHATFKVDAELGRAIAEAVWPCVASAAIALPFNSVVWRDARVQVPPKYEDSAQSKAVLTYSGKYGFCVQYAVHRDSKLMPEASSLYWSIHEPDFWTPLNQEIFKVPKVVE